MHPDLSILLGVQAGSTTIETCLASLETQRTERVEVIVAVGSHDGTADVVERRFPWARVLRCDPMDPGRLRDRAFLISRGGLIALSEPYVTFAPGWVDAALSADQYGTAVVGGAVAPSLTRIRGIGPWAAFLCEYADFLPPLTAGVTHLTPGSNVIYRREALLRSDLALGVWKTWINQGLAEQGERFWADPRLVVRHERPYSLGAFVVKRYQEGRSFGATRARNWSRVERALRMLTMPLVPALLLWRVFRATAPKRCYIVPLLLSQPLLLLYDLAWTVGEARAYVDGPNTRGT